MGLVGSREVIKRLKADGWYEVGRVGDHVQFKHPTKKRARDGDPSRQRPSKEDPRKHQTSIRLGSALTVWEQMEARMKTYYALLRKEEGSIYGVDFPDFPGCVTAGENLEQVSKRAPEILQIHIKGMLEDGEEIPEPTSLDDIIADPDNEGAVPFPVQVPGEKAKRVDITVPERVLRDIDAYARKHSMSRSAFLVDAALKVMKTG
jgi:predicted RNase H-like HicB family nuclease